MDSKLQRYTIESLAASGIALISASVAYLLRPDLWSTRIECGYSFNDSKERDRYLESLQGVLLFEAQLAGAPDWTLVACRSADGIPMRVQWLTGEEVTALRPYRPTATEPVKVPTTQADEIPSWPCAERSARLLAAGLKDDVYAPPQRFAPPSSRKARTPA